MSKTRVKPKTQKLIDSFHHYEICCSKDDYDPLMKHNYREPFFKSSLTSIQSVIDCPKVKLRLQSEDYKTPKKKLAEITNEYQQINFASGSGNPRNGIFQSLEEQVDSVRNFVALEQQKIYNEKTEKNVVLAERRSKRLDVMLKTEVKKAAVKNEKLNFPKWYQELSYSQLSHIMNLENAMREDYGEKVSRRTRKSLTNIGIISPLFHISPQEISRLGRKVELQVVDFLREIYKVVTGNYFEDEEYKPHYNCNERLILSAISHLTLPEILLELHKRLPPIRTPKFPKKPIPLPTLRKKIIVNSPYKDVLPEPFDWRTYVMTLHKWEEQCRKTPIPQNIIPPSKNQAEFKKCMDFRKKEQSKKEQSKLQNLGEIEEIKKSDDVIKNGAVAKLLEEPSENYAFEMGRGDDANLKSARENEPEFTRLDGPQNRGDEENFTQLQDNAAKYAGGKENLSRNWQEWSNKEDLEYSVLETEADRLLKSVRETMKLVNPEPQCDGCCPCREMQKAKSQKQDEVAHVVVESVVEDEEKKHVVGSIAIHSPANSISSKDSIALQIEVPKKTQVMKNRMIDGVVIDDGKSIYRTSGVAEDEIDVTQENGDETGVSFKRKIRNVGPCDCDINALFRGENLEKRRIKNDSVPKKEGRCIGQTYRPLAGTVYSCKKYLIDECCWRNPFVDKIGTEYLFDNSKFDAGKNIDYFENTAWNRDNKSSIDDESDNNYEIQSQRETYGFTLKEKSKSPDDPCLESSFDENALDLELKTIKSEILDKTFTYLVEPKRPMKMVPVRPGGNPCLCRKKRNETKKLLYNIGGLHILDGKKRKIDKNNVTQVIEGVIYATPIPSPYRSEEYIPEYELEDSPYFGCAQDDENPEVEPMTDNELMRYFLHHAPGVRKLEARKPVCECTNKRKNVRRDEAEKRWQDRQNCLKTFNKCPIMGIAGVSRPMQEETRFVVSGVSLVPRPGNEPGQETRYCVTGVAKTYVMGEAKNLISEVIMHTPYETPEQSCSSSSTCTCLNQHKCRPSMNLSTCEIRGGAIDLDSRNASHDEKPGEPVKRPRIQGTKKIGSDRDRTKRATVNFPGTAMKTDAAKLNKKKSFGKKSTSSENRNVFDAKSRKQEILDEAGEETQDLRKIVKEELNKLAREGFVFAKLPESCNVPQLQFWIMHREGANISKVEKRALMESTIDLWDKLDSKPYSVEAPILPIKKSDEKRLTYEKANETERKITSIKNVYFSNLRQERVDRARYFWNTMKFEKFPHEWFKQAFFAYMPAKESDGFVLKPWYNTSVLKL